MNTTESTAPAKAAGLADLATSVSVSGAGPGDGGGGGDLFEELRGVRLRDGEVFVFLREVNLHRLHVRFRVEELR